LRAALEQQLVAAEWLPDYIPPGVRVAHVEQRVRLGVDIRRGLEAEASGSGGDFEVGLEGLYATPRTEQVSPDGDRRAAVTATLEEVAAEHPQVVLLGDPGSGKSWLLRNYAGLLIRQQLDRLSIDHPRIPDGLEVPILVRADEFARLLDEANGDVWSALSAVVAAACSGGVSTDTRQELQRWLRDAMVSATQAPPVATTVLIDGFDERPALRHDQPDRLRDALNLLAKSPHVRLVSCPVEALHNC
jgi:energy-coupling factor transporter ATP-binding protein EcfA2